MVERSGERERERERERVNDEYLQKIVSISGEMVFKDIGPGTSAVYTNVFSHK